MLRTSGRRIDMSTPFVDAMMPDGSRLHVVIPDITRRHMAVNIRKFVLQAHSLDELVATGTLTAQAAHFLEAAVASGLDVLVSGGTPGSPNRPGATWPRSNGPACPRTPPRNTETLREWWPEATRLQRRTFPETAYQDGSCAARFVPESAFLARAGRNFGGSLADRYAPRCSYLRTPGSVRTLAVASDTG
jgi:hypothetical protein